MSDAVLMPDPVPKGRWQEYAACISEGFCPSCRTPFSHARALMPGITSAACRRCGCVWEYDRVAISPVIRWRGSVGDASWDICCFGNDDVHASAEWAE